MYILTMVHAYSSVREIVLQSVFMGRISIISAFGEWMTDESIDLAIEHSHRKRHIYALTKHKPCVYSTSTGSRLWYEIQPRLCESSCFAFWNTVEEESEIIEWPEEQKCIRLTIRCVVVDIVMIHGKLSIKQESSNFMEKGWKKSVTKHKI